MAYSLFIPAAIAVFVATLLAVFNNVHVIQEGTVGVYYRFGKIQPEYSHPGIHHSMPFISKHEAIPIGMQTLTMNNVECGTSGGVRLLFDKVEAVIRLRPQHVVETVKNYTANYSDLWISGSIHSLVNQFCTKHTMLDIFIVEFENIDEEIRDILSQQLRDWAPGIEIITIRITKPRIPEQIRKVFAAAEEKRSQLRMAERKEDEILKKTSNELKRAVMSAEKDLALAAFNSERMLQRMVNDKKLSTIENQIALAREKEKANAFYYTEMQQVLGNKDMLTPQYLELQRILSSTRNTKYYLGANIPSTIVGSPTDLLLNQGKE